MRHYEIVAVVHPDQQGRINAMIDLYKKIVTEQGGVVHRLENWGRRPLTYPIQNQYKAQYLLMNVECGNDTLEKLRETFRFSDSILRSLIIRREHAITEPSIMMQQDKPEEDDAAMLPSYGDGYDRERDGMPDEEDDDSDVVDSVDKAAGADLPDLPDVSPSEADEAIAKSRKTKTKAKSASKSADKEGADKSKAKKDASTASAKPLSIAESKSTKTASAEKGDDESDATSKEKS